MQLPLDLKFISMSNNQRRAVLAWARSHDWGGFPAVWHNKSELAVSGTSHDGKEWTIEHYHARTLRELRNWAGY